MKKILMVMLLFFVSLTISCKWAINYDGEVFGDFICQVIQVNDEGEYIEKYTSNRNCVDSFVRIMGLSEEGKQKEIIVVPEYINGYKVKEIGKINKVFGPALGSWNSNVLKRVYIPFDAKVLNVFKMCYALEKVLLNTKEVQTDVSSSYYLYINSYQKDLGKVPDNKTTNGSLQFMANVSYRYNYNESPNSGYYWIDDYAYGEKIKYIPENPTREGYTFGGWYKEENCINKWDFENDLLNNKLSNPNGSTLYQETILYAKWILE